MIGSICSFGTNSTTSISRLRSAGNEAMSASLSTTVLSPSSKAFAMSAYSTSSPSSSQTRLYRMRPPSLACTWCSATSWSSVAP